MVFGLVSGIEVIRCPAGVDIIKKDQASESVGRSLSASAIGSSFKEQTKNERYIK